MTRSDLNNWLIDLSEINSIYIFSGSEGLWFLISVVGEAVGAIISFKIYRLGFKKISPISATWSESL
mgnify:CR=1 FL=1